MRLKSKRLGKFWWIVGDEKDGPYGPYDTRADAEEDRKGIIRTFRHENEPGFITGDNMRRYSDED